MSLTSFYLPTDFVRSVDEIYPETTLSQRNAKEAILKSHKIISDLSLRQNTSDDAFTEISSEYFRKAIGSNYRKVLQPAIEKGLIEVFKNNQDKESYTVLNAENPITKSKNSKGISKRYKNRQKLSISNSIIEQSILNNNSNPNNNNSGVFISRRILDEGALTVVSVKGKKKEKTDEDRKHEDRFKRMMGTLDMDHDYLFNQAVDIVNDLSPEEFEVSKYEDKDKIIRVSYGDDFRQYPIRIGAADFKAKLRGKKLYKIDKRYYIDTPDRFITRLRANRMSAYLSALLAIKNNDLRASRNKKNNRLDTNFTNLLSELVDTVCERNNLVQKDLKNSQFVILANYLKNSKGLDTPDFNKFYNLATSGKLYEKIADKTGIDRKEAKTLMFNILFNKINAKIEHKELMYNMFPTLMGYIDRFKKRHTYRGFSVFLQKLESKMFIDNLYESIYEATGFVLTKHDSLIVRKEHERIVDRIIEEYFKNNNFKGVMTNE